MKRAIWIIVNKTRFIYLSYLRIFDFTTIPICFFGIGQLKCFEFILCPLESQYMDTYTSIYIYKYGTLIVLDSSVFEYFKYIHFESIARKTVIGK